ncbi:stalk domain-containing protein [Paenibacillus sp. DYY-L-2]|uniref:stalk domain-containing protein n=1 Tax=Paenibacillus sp. DYY-L-2 TaxID=3447013 RepID=UPI003F50C5E3
MGMKFSIKSASIGFIVGAMFFSGVSYAAGGSVYKIVQNGIDKTPVAEDLKPLVQNGRVYVPVRTIANLLDVPIGYDNVSKTITLGNKIDGKLIKNVSSYEGYISAVSYTNKFKINNEEYNAPSIVFYHTTGKGSLKIDLDGKYKTFLFSLGVLDMSSNGYSVKLTFKDDTGRVLDQQQVGNNSLVEGISVDVENVNQLVIETQGTRVPAYDAYIPVAIINPILQ